MSKAERDSLIIMLVCAVSLIIAVTAPLVIAGNR